MNLVNMNAEGALQWAIWFWTLFMVVWVVMGLRIKRAKQRETSRQSTATFNTLVHWILAVTREELGCTKRAAAA